MNHSTDYETFLASSSENSRRLRQEELVTQVTEILCEILKNDGVKKPRACEASG